MVMQFEDMVDCLKVLYQDEYEYVFYFDYSSGYDRLRPDGLNAAEMNKGYGRCQKKMRQTKIK